MALIKCSHCGGLISDKAVKCPKCGNEVIPQVQSTNRNTGIPQPPKKPKKVIQIDEEKLKKNNWGKTSIVIAVCLMGIAVFIDQQYGDFGGFSAYGGIAIIITFILLIWKSISAITYLKAGRAKITLYNLRKKWVTCLIWFLSITGIIALGIGAYQSRV